MAGLPCQALELRHDDLQATNTRDAPERVKPAPLQHGTIDGYGRLRARLEAGVMECDPLIRELKCRFQSPDPTGSQIENT